MMEPSTSIASDDTLTNDSPVEEVPKDASWKSKKKGGKEAQVKRKIVRVLDKQEAPPDRVWIPKEHKNRTLVLCFDGTGDHFDSDVSTVENFTPL